MSSSSLSWERASSTGVIFLFCVPPELPPWAGREEVLLPPEEAFLLPPDELLLPPEAFLFPAEEREPPVPLY